MCLRKLVSLITFKKKEIEYKPKLIPWENDCLGYKQIASRFSTIIKTLDKSFSIISLEGYDQWGKTFFLKEWIKDLKQQNEIAAYYSAWDINALDQPMPSLLHFLFEDLFASYEVKRSVIQQFKNINQELFSLNTLGKLISKSPLAMLSVFLDAAKEADKKDIGFILSELTLLQRRKENTKDFKRQLANVINKIRKGKNIYITVDDLEICRPKFTIDFLESIKYMLDVEGLVFIISVNQNNSNVQKAINTILGQNFSLKSFTDLSLRLSKQPIVKFIRKLFQNIELPKKSKGLIIDRFIFYAENFSLSLKAIQYCVKKVKLCFLNYPKKKLFDPNLLIFLVILQSVNTDLYEELYLSNQKTLKKIKSYFILNNQKEWEKLKISLEDFFKKEDSKAIKQIRNALL